MIIILEGPDGGGKSTLAKNLINENGYTYLMHHTEYKNVENITHKFFTSMLDEYVRVNRKENSLTVLDRCWISEMIYGKVFRGGSNRVSSKDRIMLEQVAHYCKAVIVLCMPTFKKCRETFESRQKDELLDNVNQLRQVYHLYEHLGAEFKLVEEPYTNLPLVEYDYSIDTIDTLFKRIKEAK